MKWFLAMAFFLIPYVVIAAPELIFEESAGGLKTVLSDNETSLIDVKFIERKDNISAVDLIFLKTGDFRGLKCEKSSKLSGWLKSIGKGRYTIVAYQLSPYGAECSLEGYRIKNTAELNEKFKLASLSVAASLEKPFLVDDFAIKQYIKIHFGNEKVIEELLKKTPYKGKKFFVVYKTERPPPPFSVLFREPIEAFGHSFKSGTILIFKENLELQGTVISQEIAYINKIPCIDEISIDKFGNLERCRTGEDFKFRDFYIPKNTFLWFKEQKKGISGFLDISRISCLSKDTKIRGKKYKRTSIVFFEDDGTLREVDNTDDCFNYD